MTQTILSQSPSKTRASKASFTTHAVLAISQLLEYWEETGKAEMGQSEKIRKFLSEGNG